MPLDAPLVSSNGTDIRLSQPSICTAQMIIAIHAINTSAKPKTFHRVGRIDNLSPLRSRYVPPAHNFLLLEVQYHRNEAQIAKVYGAVGV